MAPHSLSVDVISVMTESSTGRTVSNCLRTHGPEFTRRRRAGGGKQGAEVKLPFVLDVGVLQVDVAGGEDPLLTDRNRPPLLALAFFFP